MYAKQNKSKGWEDNNVLNIITCNGMGKGVMVAKDAQDLIL
jgi:hypothetical protein